MPTQRLTNDIITAAIEGFEAQKKRIDGQIAELRSFLADSSAELSASQQVAPRKRGKFSDATRLKMKAAQQKRWARIKGESEPSTPVAIPAKPKRQLSAAGRQAIAEAARRRWASTKTSRATPEPAATKKATRKKAAAKKAAAKKVTVKLPTI